LIVGDASIAADGVASMKSRRMVGSVSGLEAFGGSRGRRV
jgi:hypothetical protein